MLKRISIISLCFLHLFTQAAWAVDVLPVGPVLSPPIPGIVLGPNVNTVAPLNPNVSYIYDTNGNLVTMSDPITGTTGYSYDVLDRVTTITTPPSGDAVGFSYDTLNRRAQVTFPNGVTTDYAYDSISQLTSLAHKLGAATLSSFDYTYDNTGNRTNLSAIRSGLTAANSLTWYKYPAHARHGVYQAVNEFCEKYHWQIWNWIIFRNGVSSRSKNSICGFGTDRAMGNGPLFRILGDFLTL